MKLMELTNIDGRKVIVNVKEITLILEPRQTDIAQEVGVIIVTSNMAGTDCLRAKEKYDAIYNTLMDDML